MRHLGFFSKMTRNSAAIAAITSALTIGCAGAKPFPKKPTVPQTTSTNKTQAKPRLTPYNSYKSLLDPTCSVEGNDFITTPSPFSSERLVPDVLADGETIEPGNLFCSKEHTIALSDRNLHIVSWNSSCFDSNSSSTEDIDVCACAKVKSFSINEVLESGIEAKLLHSTASFMLTSDRFLIRIDTETYKQSSIEVDFSTSRAQMAAIGNYFVIAQKSGNIYAGRIDETLNLASICTTINGARFWTYKNALVYATPSLIGYKIKEGKKDLEITSLVQ